MAIFDILKAIARKVQQGAALTASESRHLREMSVTDIAEASRAGRLTPEEEGELIGRRKLEQMEEQRRQGASETEEEQAESLRDSIVNPSERRRRDEAEIEEINRRVERGELSEKEASRLRFQTVQEQERRNIREDFGIDVESGSQSGETRLRPADELSDAEREFEAGRQTPPPRGSGPRRLQAAAGVGVGGAVATNEARAGNGREDARVMAPSTVSRDQFETDSTNRAVFESNLQRVLGEASRPIYPERFSKDTATYNAAIRAANGDEKVFDAYQNTLSSMRRGVKPDDVKQMENFIASDENRQRREVVQATLTDPSVPQVEKQEILEGFVALRESEDRPSLKDAFQERVAFMDEAPTEAGAELQTERLASLSEISALNNYISSLASSIIERGAGDSAVEKAAEFGELMIPFVEQTDLMQTMSDAGFEIGVMDPVLFGSAKRKIADTLVNMPPAQRLEAARSLVEAAREHGGAFIDDNQFAQLAQIEPILREGGPENWEVWLDNFVGILDIVGVGAVLRGLLGGGSKAARAARIAQSTTGVDQSKSAKPHVIFRGTDERGKPRFKLRPSDVIGNPKGSPQDQLSAANPDVASRTATAALFDETGRTADALGTTKEDIWFSHVAPKPFGYDIDGAPQPLYNQLRTIEDIEEVSLRKTESIGGAFTPEEKAAIRAKEWENIRNISGLATHVNKTRMRWNEEGMATRAMFGPNESHGYADIQDAIRSQDYKFGPNDPDTEVVFHAFDDDSFTVVPKNTVDSARRTGVRAKPKNGEYFIQHDRRMPYNEFSGNIFGAPAATGYISGRAAAWLKDATSRFTKQIRIPAFTAADNAANIEQRLLREVARPWANLPETGKHRVIDILSRGDEDQQVYSFRQLTGEFGLTEKEASTYFAYRRAMDAMWNLQNRDLRKTMVRSGVRTVQTNKYGTRYGRPIDSGADARREILDRAPNDKPFVDALDATQPGTVRIHADDVARSYEANEGTLVRLWSPEMAETGRHEFMWIRQSDLDGRNVVLDVLDQYPMPYRKGHISRFYNENWFVERRIKSGRINGHPASGAEDTRLREVIGADESKQAAEKIRDDLMAEAERAGETDKYEYVVRPDRSHNQNPVDRAQRDWEVMQNRGLLTQRKRGERLKKGAQTPEMGYDAARIEDPFNSFVRAVRATSRHVAYRDVLETLNNRFLALYGDITNGEIVNADQIRALGNNKNIEASRIADAQNFKQYIEALSRTPQTFDSNFSDLMFSLAQSLESSKVFGETAARGARKIGDLQPIRRARSLPFVAFLALNPLRQFAVQGGQLLQLAGIMPGYVLTGRMTRDLGAVMIGSMVHRNKFGLKAAGHRVGAKMMGISEEEFGKIMRAFMDESGLPYNIDHHLLVAGMNDPYTTGSALSRNFFVRQIQRTPRGFHNVIGLSKKVGFDAGEMVNVTGTWLAARRRWMQQNPERAAEWNARSNLDEVNTLAREMSFGMTAPGRFAYQDGVASLFFQFWSVPHKAVLSVTSSNLYSKAEKAKIAAMNAALFGGSGVIAGQVLMSNLEDNLDFQLPTGLRRSLHGGFVDLGFNVIADSMLNEDADPSSMLLSENFSPFAQTVSNIANLYENTDRSMLEWVKRAVPAASAGSRVMRAYQDISMLFATTEWDDVTDPEHAKRIFKAAGSIASGLSNYYKFQYANATGRMVSSSGDPTVKVSRAESMARLFGIQTQDEKDYYDLLGDTLDRQSSLEEDGRRIYDSVKRIYQLYSDDPDKMEAELEGYQYILGALPEEDQKIVFDEFKRQNRFDRTNAEDDLFSLMLRRQVSTKGGLEGIQGLREEVQNNEALDASQKDDLINLLNKSFRSRDVPLEEE